MNRLLGRLGGVLLLSLGFATAGVSGPPPAFACDCANSPDDVAYAARADAVFVGRLVARQQPTPYTSSLDPEVLTFVVSAVYKGDVADEQQVVTAVDGASCGLELAGSGPHLVFARIDPRPQEQSPNDDQLLADLCGGSRPLSAAGPDPGLGTPATRYPSAPSATPTTASSPTPAAATPEPPVETTGSTAVLVVGATAAVGAAAALLVWRRRRTG